MVLGESSGFLLFHAVSWAEVERKRRGCLLELIYEEAWSFET